MSLTLWLQDITLSVSQGNIFTFLKASNKNLCNFFTNSGVCLDPACYKGNLEMVPFLIEADFIVNYTRGGKFFKGKQEF